MSHEIAQDLSPLIRVYKDGRVERLKGNDVVPASLDPKTCVQSTDFAVSTAGVSVRLYIPASAMDDPSQNQKQKLPLVVYFHGGGFCIETAFSPAYHDYLNSLSARAKAIVVSIDYRRAPEHPLPIAYDDSWLAVEWVSSHSRSKGPSEWLNSSADFGRVFFAGDSAGANIAHHMAMRVGLSSDLGFKLVGSVLVHPYFWGSQPVGAEPSMDAGLKEWVGGFWKLSCPTSSGFDDPLINPSEDPNLGKIGGEKLLICVAEKDCLRERGLHYSDVVRKSGWGGDVDVMEALGEDHIFHLFHPGCDNAVAMLHSVSSFINS